MINLQLIIWIQILYIFGFSPLIYKNSRIKYSKVSAISIYDIKISYYKLYKFLGYMILLLNLLMFITRILCIHYSQNIGIILLLWLFNMYIMIPNQ